MTREERTKLIKHLKYNRSIGAAYLITDKDADEIIKALEQKPKTEVLDKIAAEIKNIEYLSCPQPYVVLNDVLGIIDKYKAESEGEE